MKLFKCSVIALSALLCAGAYAAQESAAEKWKRLTDTGWAQADAQTKTTWQAIQKLLTEGIATQVKDWQEPYHRFGKLRDSLASQEMIDFINHYFIAYEIINQAERKKLMNMVDVIASGLFGTAALTNQYQEAIAQINEELYKLGMTLDQKYRGETGIGTVAVDVEELLKKRASAQPSGERKKEAAARSGQTGNAQLAQQRQALEESVSTYLKVATGGDAQVASDAFTLATTQIGSLNLVPESEKNEAMERMIAATVQEPTTVRPVPRPPAGPAPKRPSAPAKVPTAPVRVEQPKRAVELRTTEQPKRVAPAVPVRPSVAEQKTSADDKEKLVRIKADFWRGALSKDKDIESFAVMGAREALAKLSTVSEPRKKEILTYFEYVIKLPHDQRVMEKQRNWTLDVLDPKAWSK